MTPATRRLISHAGIRQVTASVRADRAALLADRAVNRQWSELLDWLELLSEPRYRPLVQRYAQALARQLYQSPINTIADALRRDAHWGRQTTARALTLALPGDTLQYAAIAARLTEARKPSKKAKDAAEDLFPAQSTDEVDQLVYAGDWRERLAAGTKLGKPEDLARVLAAGIAAGKPHEQIARDLAPLVNGVKSSAKRIARTESLRVANETQMQTYEALGDLIIGYQIHATLDQHTRPEHAARNGTIYYANPKPGQLGYDKMPRPPLEADGTPAWNCRCWLSPVLSEPEHLAQPGADTSAFTAPAGPDPVVYGEWFDQADEQRRRMAVGTRRYSVVRSQIGGNPDWEHFVEPDGALVPLDKLRQETKETRARRVAQVKDAQARKRELKQTVGAFGYLPDDLIQRIFLALALQKNPLT